MLALAACAYYKPLRILAPQAVGLTCTSDGLCLDDLTRLSEARALTNDAAAFVEEALGPLSEVPRILFCSTKECFAKFGNPEVAALYFWGAETLLINEIGWEPHILRHELIHHWQAENLGGVRAALALPRWYIEGMAYHLSEDPRPVIPHPEAQAQREQFEAWLKAGNAWRVPPG